LSTIFLTAQELQSLEITGNSAIDLQASCPSSVKMVSLKALALLFGVAAAAPAMKTLPNKYIVTLKSTTDTTQLESHVEWARDVHTRSLSRRSKNGITGGVDKIWTTSFKGYSGEFDAATVEEIKSNDDVSEAAPSSTTVHFAT
jgi:oryzin